jgi:hypothetical protein
MSILSIELLTKERVTELWPVLEPLVESACKGNTIAKGEMDAGHVLLAVQVDKAVMFAGFLDGEVTCILALQFFDVNGHKGADVMALAGRHLLRFKAAFWEPIIEWLVANDVEFLDAYTPTERAEVYLKKFGFTESCAYVRMNLGVKHE